MGVATPGKTCGLTCKDPAHQELGVQVFGQVWNQTKPFLRSKPRPLASYPDPLLTLLMKEHTLVSILSVVW